MKLRYFKIEAFPSFQEIEINFDNKVYDPNTNNFINCLVGVNGSGKTRMLQTLATLFFNLQKKCLPKFSVKVVYDIEINDDVKTVCFIHRIEGDYQKQETNTKLIIFKEEYKCSTLPNCELSVDDTLSNSCVEKIYSSQSIFSKEVLGSYVPKVFLYKTGNTISNEEYFLRQHDLKLAICVLFAKRTANEQLTQTFLNILSKLGLSNLETNLEQLLRECVLESEISKLDNIELFERLRQSKLDLRRLKISITKNSNNVEKLEYDDLGDGEQALLGQIALFTLLQGSKNTLMLLDGPEAYLHPVWKYEYLNLLKESVGKESRCHFIICTHDALSIGSLRKEQVQIIKQEQGKIAAYQPSESPQGMGIAGLLKSEMFGLRSTLDRGTLQALDERSQLIAKKATKGLTEVEEARLKSLRDYLDDLGFAMENRDPIYQVFIQKMYEVRRRPLTDFLTPEELLAEELLAQKIVAELVKKKRRDEFSDLAKELSVQLAN